MKISKTFKLTETEEIIIILALSTYIKDLENDIENNIGKIKKAKELYDQFIKNQ